MYLYAQGHLCVEVTPEMGCISSSEDKALTGLNKNTRKDVKQYIQVQRSKLEKVHADL